MENDIDLVYLWVDGSDPKWVEKRNACIGLPKEGSGVNCKGRYADNDELKYSLRSVELYAPWIRRIFIVTDEQIPRWLDTSNPKIRIVDHKEIMPAVCLPCFNSTVIEHHLHRIPGLAERFLFANDDMFFNQPVAPGDFFAADGLPIARMNRRPFRKLTLFIREKVLRKPIRYFPRVVRAAALAVERKYGTYYKDKAHHNVDPYLKSEYAHVREVFDAEIEPMLGNHVRSSNDIQRHLYTYAALAEKRMHLRYVGQRTSFRFHIENKRHYRKLAKYNPLLFCMNDSEYATDADRKRVTAFLSRRFAEKSSFEK